MKRDKTKVGIRCTKCGDELFSISRHDFRWCKCNSVAVDGGDEYLKVTGMDWQEISNGYAEWLKTLKPSKMSQDEYARNLNLLFEDK